MKRDLFFPLLALSGGAAALVLRLLQARTGFEADTGLPVPGNLYARLLLLLLVVLAELFLLASRKLPDERERTPQSFTAGFATAHTGLLVLPVAGIFLLGLSGAVEMLSGLGVGPASWISASAEAAGFRSFSRLDLFQGALSVVSAVCLFPAAAACSRGQREAVEARRALRPWLLLVPVVCMTVRLVLSYRIYSLDPSLEAYCVELLALVFLTLGSYRLASFAYQAGRTRSFAVYAAMAFVSCAAAVGDGHGLVLSLLYIGGGLTLMGFLLLRLTVLAAPWDNI